MDESRLDVRRLLLVANPIAGGGRGRSRAHLLAAALQRRGVDVAVHLTAGPGDARARAAQAGAEPWDGLVAVGGDGTVNEVLGGMPDPCRPLGVLPVGTANVLARELRLPRDPEQAAALLTSGQLRRRPIGIAGERRFLLFCGVGLDGAVVQRLAAVRTGTLGKHKWLAPILHTAWHWPRFALRARLPDGAVLDGLSSVLVTLVRNYGGVMLLPRSIASSSDLLHVLCFRARSRAAWVAMGLRGVFDRLQPGSGFELHTATSVRIEGEAPHQIDGDAAGRGDVEVRMLADGARVFAPHAAAGE